MMKNEENNTPEEIGLVTPTPSMSYHVDEIYGCWSAN